MLNRYIQFTVLFLNRTHHLYLLAASKASAAAGVVSSFPLQEYDVDNKIWNISRETSSTLFTTLAYHYSIYWQRVVYIYRHLSTTVHWVLQIKWNLGAGVAVLCVHFILLALRKFVQSIKPLFTGCCRYVLSRRYLHFICESAIQSVTDYCAVVTHSLGLCSVSFPRGSRTVQLESLLASTTEIYKVLI